MRSCRAQLRWSARGGVICGFHFSRTSRTPDSSALEITPSSDANESAPAVKESRRAMRKKDKKLANWQHLLSVVGDGQLRVEYCEFDGNGLGNACVCVWGRSEQKKKKRKKKRGVSSNVSTPLVATPVSTTPTAGTPRETTPTSTTATASAVVTTTVATPKIAATAVPPASVTPRVTTPVPTGITPPVPPASVPAVPNASTPATTTARITTPAAAVTSLSAVVKALTPATTASVVGPATAPAEATTTPHVATPVTATFVTNTLRSTPPGVTPATTTPRIIAAPATATTSTKMVPAADTLLVLQNCRIRGAGSSGVLLMRGSLVMSMNTVEGNGHSGVTVLGGQALLRRNKIQRNARFGLRLLYHAGNVIVEDNVVFGNACGNLDVDNSGRRFVVRLNDMDKGKKSTEKLPHSHGKLRLKTYRVLEKEVPRRQPSAPKPVVASAMSEYWRRQLAGAGGATATSTSLGSAPFTAASARPVITANAMMAAGIPMGFMRPVVFPPGAHVSHLPMAFASLGAKPTIPTVTLNRSTTTTQPTTTVANLQRTVSAPGIATAAARNGALHTPTTVATTTATKSGALPTSTSVATTMNTGALPTSTSVVTSTAVRTGALPTSTSITTTTAAKTAALPTPTSVATTTTSIALTTTSLIEPPKKRRKRRPKTEQIIVGGREIVLRDTCEKVTEKVVKPRRPKEQQPQTPSIAPSLLQQMTSPSALQLKFAPGSTAAAVAAAMSAMMANTAKMQAVASSQLQSVGSVTMTANAATPKPAVLQRQSQQ
ncbi:hypothetical protein ON010_g17130 [Phytophthora cinnamomi]|nr:hypothetical protein ON010_g17130 [Phytophthora cinnamomi]